MSKDVEWIRVFTSIALVVENYIESLSFQATGEDSGKYTVTASNEGGSVSSTVSVMVTTQVTAEAPSLAEMPKPITVKIGETITITCKILGKNNEQWTMNLFNLIYTCSDHIYTLDVRLFVHPLE